MKKFIMMCISLSSISSSASVLRETNYYNNYLYTSAGENILVEAKCNKDIGIDDVTADQNVCKDSNKRHKTLILKEMNRFHLSFYGVHRCYNEYSDSEYNDYNPKHFDELLALKDSEKAMYENLQARGYGRRTTCLEMEKVADYLKLQLIEKMEDSSTVHLVSKSSMENSILDDTDFDRSYYDVPCGLEGSIEEKINDCSVYPNSKAGPLKRVSRVDTGETVYLNLETQTFWSNRVNSSEVFDNIVPYLWRTANAEDIKELPQNIKDKFKYISAKPIDDILEPYSSTLENRKTGDKISFDYAGGIATITLIKSNGEKELIKTVSLSENPTQHFENRFQHSGYRRVRSITAGYPELTSGMARTMNMGMFAFFPVTLTVYGVYSLSYGPAYLLDLIGPERRAVRKMDKLLRGISSKTGDKSFQLVLDTFERSNLN